MSYTLFSQTTKEKSYEKQNHIVLRITRKYLHIRQKYTSVGILLPPDVHLILVGKRELVRKVSLLISWRVSCIYMRIQGCRRLIEYFKHFVNREY